MVIPIQDEINLAEMKYCIIETANEQPAIKYPFYLELLTTRRKREKKEKYIIKELPIIKQLVEHIGIQGIKLTLPYTYVELQQFDIEEINNIFHRIIMREDVQNIVAEERLRKYIDDEMLMDGNMISLFYIEEIINWIKREHKITQKEMHILLIDSGGCAAGFVLSRLGENMNYLTICTERPEYFDKYINHMYEQTGLIVSLASRKNDNMLDGNIVIDLSEDIGEDYKYYPDHSVLVQMIYAPQSTKLILANRKDIICYNQIYLHKIDENVDNRVIQGALGGKQQWITLEKLERMCQTVKDYQLNLLRLGIRI